MFKSLASSRGVLAAFAVAALFVATPSAFAASHIRINSVTVNGVPMIGWGIFSVRVPAESSISTDVEVTLNSGGHWRSTGWLISTNNNGSSYTCVDTPDEDWQKATWKNPFPDNTHTHSFTITAPSKAGTYDLYVRAFGDDNCAGNDGDSFKQDGGIIVKQVKHDQVITVTAPSTAVYGSSFDVNPTSDSHLAVTTGATGSCSAVGTHVTMTSGTGSCTLTFDQAGSDSFNPASAVTKTVSATPKPITVTANGVTKVYGTSDPALTYTTDVALVGSDHFSGSLARESGEDVGIYPISQGSLDAGANYAITFAGNHLTITPADAVVSLVEPLSFTYDGAPHAATAVTVPSEGFDVTFTYNGDTTAPTNAGKYAVVATASSTNPDYSNGTANGTLVIGKAAQTIGFGPLADREAASDDFGVSAEASSGLPVSFSASGSCTMADEGNMVHLTGVGTCTITASQAGDENYFAAEDVSQAFATLAPKAPTISPNSVVFHGSVDVTITANEEGDTLHYTLDGSTPTCESATYAIPFTFGDTATLAAVACDADGYASDAVSAVFSPAAGNGGGSNSGGQVLGAAIGPVDVASTTAPVATSTPEVIAPAPEVASTTPACAPYLSSFIKLGAKNDPDQVKLLQQFLNENLGSKLPVTGVYGELSAKAVKQFQEKYADQVIKPWNDLGFSFKEGTGYVYKTTVRWMNILHCGLTSDTTLFPLSLP